MSGKLLTLVLGLVLVQFAATELCSNGERLDWCKDEWFNGATKVGKFGAVSVAMLVVAAAGFAGPGIVAGSFAAWLMSWLATLNGGGVAAGSIVAVLQSVGAAGFSAKVSAIITMIGGAVAGGVALATSDICKVAC